MNRPQWVPFLRQFVKLQDRIVHPQGCFLARCVTVTLNRSSHALATRHTAAAAPPTFLSFSANSTVATVLHHAHQRVRLSLQASPHRRLWCRKGPCSFVIIPNGVLIYSEVLSPPSVRRRHVHGELYKYHWCRL